MLTCSLEIYQDLRHMKITIKKCRGLKKNHGWMMGLGRNLMMIYVMIASRFNSKVDTFNGPLITRVKRDMLEEYWRGKKEEEESSEDAWSNYSSNNGNDAIHADQERFDNHEPMEDDDDDIGDLDDYLIPQDASYYVDEEEERFKERKSKLLGIPYKKPPTFKSKKFEVIKYSFGPMK
ncbi:hypothetical protein Tco_0801579 [Tanacetum coccineum]|uniref:Uncharacterized protein n=1 Tax=Tanacetum coccineum TaxID=301880 RepID=A0ABQ4ZZA1_9ASTR